MRSAIRITLRVGLVINKNLQHFGRFEEEVRAPGPTRQRDWDRRIDLTFLPIVVSQPFNDAGGVDFPAALRLNKQSESESRGEREREG